MELSPIAIVVFMAVVNERLIAGFVTPIFEKFSLDKFWLTYIAWLTGGLLTWATGMNLFAGYVPNPIVGLILTALVAGGGSNLLHNLFDKPKE